ncbi:PQ-loop domain-containing transporter [Thermococcus zilligii]|uniref:PQ-loop domain-containing transporter n=1 Tax=Thermococcus zilligii TaxID=54076 RepID=UPI00029B2346|nr:PQ-loop domain-containing transporter [Thermococcus zilligii]
MSGVELLGLVGMLLLVGSWVPQTWETIKTKNCPLNLKFILVYFTASALLTVYAYLPPRDWIFTALNGLAALQSGVNLYVKLRYL